MNGWLPSLTATLRGAFFRNFLTVMAGSTLSQAILVATAPVLSRIYGPDAFGVTGIVMSVTAILVPVSCLTLDLAIVLPDRKEKARGLLKLSVYLATAVTVASVVILVSLWDTTARLLGLEDHAWLMLFIPTVLFLSGMVEILHRWLMRAEQFALISKLNVCGALSVSVLKIAGGLAHPAAIVILAANAFGAALHLGAILFVAIRLRSAPLAGFFGREKLRDLCALLSEFRDFPKFKAPQMLVGMVSGHLPLIIIGAMDGASAAGLYSIARTALALPIQIIGQSLWTVLNPKFAEIANRGQKLAGHLVAVTVGLAALVAPIFGLVIFFGPELFVIVFGSEWAMAGEFGRHLSIWIFMNLVSIPAASAITVIRRQRWLLALDSIALPLRIGALIIGIRYYESAVAGVMAMSIISAASLAFMILWTIFQCRSDRHQNSGEL